MDQSKNLHEGHRERLINRFLENPDGTADHELLEILLFSMIPRKDTNLIAHKLLNTFGGLYGVFNASAPALMTIDGVGKRVASEIVVVGKIVAKLLEIKKPPNPTMRSFYQIKNYIVEDFEGLYEEKFIMYLLDGKYRKIVGVEFDDKSISSVTAEVSDVAKALAIHNGRYAIIAHNHPSGNVEPSLIDDATTKKLSALCSLHGVDLLDHVIIHETTAFSYYQEGRLEKLKQAAALGKIFNE